MTRPQILSVSLSTLVRDARVLRQLEVLARHGEVTSVGYGETPPHVLTHLRVEDRLASLPQNPSGVALLATRRLRAAEQAAPAVRRAHDLLEGRRFDLVVANDARALPLAHAVADGAPIWADMHEWAAEEFSHVRTWRLLVAPLMDHLCRVYLPRSAAVTTVCEPLADRYASRYGIAAPQVVRNAGPWRDLEPTPLEPTVACAWSTAAAPSRGAISSCSWKRRTDSSIRPWTSTSSGPATADGTFATSSAWLRDRGG